MTGRRNVLVTGAGGFLGTALCRQLGQQACNLIGLDIAAKPRGWRWDWIQSPLDDTDAYLGVLNQVDVVIHAAWIGFPGTTTGFQRDLDRDVTPTLNFYLNCCNAGVSRFVFLSSGGTVYGNATELPIPEHAAPKPISYYGASKVATEVYLGMLGHVTGRPATIIRLANPYGPGQMPWRGQGVIATALACALAGTEFQVWGSGEATRDYIYIDDAAIAIAAVALSGKPAATYNVGSGVGISLNDVVGAVQDVTGGQLTIQRYPDRNIDVSANVLSIDRIRADIDWYPKVTFAVGVRRSYDWLIANRSVWLTAKPASS